MDLEAHFDAVETYGGIWVCVTVIENISDSLCFLLGVGGSCKGVQGNNHGAIDVSPIIQGVPKYFLKACGACGIKRI